MTRQQQADEALREWQDRRDRMRAAWASVNRDRRWQALCWRARDVLDLALIVAGIASVGYILGRM